MKEYIVSSKESNQTLEKYIKKVLGEAPLSFIYKLFRKKDVKVNGHWQDLKYVINDGDVINVYITDVQYDEFKKKYNIKKVNNISSWIVYEDNNILIVNKPRNILVQKDNSGDTALDDMVISYLIEKKEYDPNEKGYVPAPSHRIDRNTCGLVVFGKNLRSLQILSDAMKDKSALSKEYISLVKGKVNSKGTISYPLKKLNNGRVIRDDKEGKEAITTYSLIKSFDNYSLVKINLLTGRTHQIRVHFSLIDHPVIGDSKYGDYLLNKTLENKYNFKNQFLIAHKLTFNYLKDELSYLNGKSFEVDLPPELINLVDELQK